MGKLLITNNDLWKKKLKTIFYATGLVSNYEDEDTTIYKKRYVDNKNFIQKDDRLIACVGTWIYRDKAGSEALQILFRDVFENNLSIKEIRKELIGTYSVCIKEGKKKKVFVDETHTYALYYYYNTEGNYAITNTYYHVELCAGQEMNLEVIKVILAKTGLSSHDTAYKNIYRLMENEVLEINGNQFKVTNSELNNYTYDLETKEKSINLICSIAERLGSQLKKNVKSTLLFATGGADSRLKLALDRYLDKKVRLAYWGGDNCITNGTASDKKVNEEIAYRLNLQTEYFDVSESFEQSITLFSEKDCERYGEYTAIYAHNTKWLALVDEIHRKYPEVDEIEMGYDPDVLREIGNIDITYDQPYNINDMIHAVFLRSGLFKMLFREDDELYDLIQKDTINEQTNDLELEDLSRQEAANLFNYSRLDMGCVLVNFFNEYFFCCNMLYCKPAWDFANSVSYEYKMGSQLSIGMIKKWEAGLLEIPIFSGGHYKVVDRKKYSLKKTKSHAFLSWLKPRVIMSPLYDKIYVKYFEQKIFPEFQNSDDIYNECIKRMKNEPILEDAKIIFRENISRKGFDLSALAGMTVRLELYKQIQRQIEN